MFYKSSQGQVSIFKQIPRHIYMHQIPIWMQWNLLKSILNNVFFILFSLIIIIIIYIFSASPSNSLMLLWLMPRISFQFFWQNSPANHRRPFPDSCHNSCFHKNLSELLSSLKPTQQIPQKKTHKGYSSDSQFFTTEHCREKSHISDYMLHYSLELLKEQFQFCHCCMEMSTVNIL